MQGRSKGKSQDFCDCHKASSCTTPTAKPASILKKGSQPFVRAAAEAINKAITFGAMSVKVALQGQHVSFNASLVGTSDKEDAGDGKEADKPEKGTPEELAQAEAVSASAQFGHTTIKCTQESMLDKHPSLDEPVPKKPKAKLESVKEAAAEVKLAAIDPEKDSLEDMDNEKEMPVAAKSPDAAFTITAQDSKAPSATDKMDVVSVELKMALSYSFTLQQLRDFDPIARNQDDSYDEEEDEDDNSDVFDEDYPTLKLVKILHHILGAKFLDQYAMETVVFDPTVADVPDDKKWVISMVQTVKKKAAFWSYAR